MLIAAFALAAAVAALLTPLAIRLAWQVGWLDHPEARKLHTSATALLGGAVVFVAALVGGAIALRGVPHGHGIDGRQGLLVLGGAAVSLAWGLWDDRFGMGVRVKMIGQILAGTLLLTAVGPPALGLPGWLEAALGMLALVSLMNAVNFLDNMNGMVGGIAAVTLAGYAAHSAMSGETGLAAAQLALAGACGGFLPFNFPRARIFLGDAGSLLLGYSLGASAALAYAVVPPGWGRVGPLFGLVFPAFDLIFVVVNRTREGRRLSQGGKDHSNHRLARVLRCPIRTVILVWCSTAALSVSGLVVRSSNRPLPTLLLSGLWLLTLSWTGLRLSSVPSADPSPPARS